jgi:hypothetical protein
MNEMVVQAGDVVVETSDVETGEFSWRAVIAGALVGASVIFFLLFLGAGLGLSLVTLPEADSANITTGLTLGGVYFFATIAFGMCVGGYLAGRLMGPVLESEAEELFHATAHGLVVWALGTVATATMVAIGGFILSASGLNAAAIMGAPNTTTQQSGYLTPGITGYWVDTLFRPGAPVAPAAAPAPATAPVAGVAPTVAPVVAPAPAPMPMQVSAEVRAEVSRILTVGLAGGEALTRPDHDRIVTLVEQNTGVDQAEATRRVDDVQARIRQQVTNAAETARKAMRNISLLLAASLIFGALVASASAVLGRSVDDEARLAQP